MNTQTQEALKMDLENLIDRFNEGWHEGIEIDASDIMLLSNLREALEQQEVGDAEIKKMLNDIEYYKNRLAKYEDVL